MLLLSIYALLTKHEVKIAGYWLSPSAHLTPSGSQSDNKICFIKPKGITEM